MSYHTKSEEIFVPVEFVKKHFIDLNTAKDNRKISKLIKINKVGERTCRIREIWQSRFWVAEA